mgnify:CR=1 FL=1
MGSSPLTAIGHANANCAYVAANDFSIPCYKNQNKFVENKFVENKFVKHKFVQKKNKKNRERKIIGIYRYFVIAVVVIFGGSRSTTQSKSQSERALEHKLYAADVLCLCILPVF